jgi:hypothetical protein
MTRHVAAVKKKNHRRATRYSIVSIRYGKQFPLQASSHRINQVRKKAVLHPALVGLQE